MTPDDIFIIDDNPINVNLLAGILRDHNYRVRIANTGRRALTAVQAMLPDLIMLDITMPEMDGYEVCQHLKANPVTRDIPVIFISALDEVMDKVKAFQIGGVDYVTKPFQVEEVLVRIENQLKLSKLKKELEQKNAELSLKNVELGNKNKALDQKNEELARKNEELLESFKRADRIFSALSDVLPGTVLDGKYRLENKIGTGGFGAVFKGTHLSLNRPIAVKVFRPKPGNDSPEEVERFRREGVSACRINHPNAITVLDSGISTEGIAYLVMELLEGKPLSEELKTNPWVSLHRTAEILRPVCEVLTEAHAVGIIHRDIKPDNIFLHQTKDGETIKVLDFGIAKLIGPDTGESFEQLTGTGAIIGTPSYMAPERLSCKSYDGRADVYSLGVMAYEMLCGRLPFVWKGKNLAEVIFQLLHDDPRSLRSVNPHIPQKVEEVVMRALLKEPHSRPTAWEFFEAFAVAVSEQEGTYVKTKVVVGTEEGVENETTTLNSKPNSI